MVEETAGRDIQSILERFSKNRSNTIVLFVEEHIYSSLIVLLEVDRLRESSYLKGVHSIDDSHAPVSAADVAVYIFNPFPDHVAKILEHFMAYNRANETVVPKFVCVPEKTALIEQIIEQDYEFQDKFPEVEITSFDFDLQHIDAPLLSMNLPESFRRVFCEGDLFIIRCVARFIYKFESVFFGPASDTVAVGPLASRVLHILKEVKQDNPASAATKGSSVDKLFIVDRSVDLATPLLTQQSYEGMIDELYDFDCCRATFPFKLNDGEVFQGYFSGLNDNLFRDIRDKNFNTIGSFLYDQSLTIKKKYEQRKDLNQIKEIREFVENLSDLQETHRLISIHTTIAQNVGKSVQTPRFRKQLLIEQYIIQQSNGKEVLEFMEDLIDRKCSLQLVVRLVCLYAVVSGGLKVREYHRIKERLMLSYGICETLSVFFSLAKCGLLCRQKNEKKCNEYAQWQKCGMGYKRAVENDLSKSVHDSEISEDVSQAYGNYVPPIVRLLEAHLNKRSGSGDSLSTVIDALSSDTTHQAGSFIDISSAAKCTTSILFVIGGLTAAEINSMRLLQKKFPQLPFLICTTDIISGNRLMRSLGISSSSY